MLSHTQHTLSNKLGDRVLLRKEVHYALDNF